MKLAIISDIHGNLESLKSTLNDIQKRQVDKIICLGDIIAKGIHSKECLELIKKHCHIVLQGNCDDYFSSEQDLSGLPKQEQIRIKWNQSKLTKEDRNYLTNLPFSYECYISGSLVRFFHATPESFSTPVLNVDTIETKYKMFLPSSKTESQKTADIVVYGHIHHPYLDKLYNKTLISVGSIGNSFDPIRNPNKDSNPLETTKSNYLLIEGEIGEKEYDSSISFQFIRVPYDITKELEGETDNPEAENYRFELKQGKYRDMTKINENHRKLGINPETI